MHVHVLDDHKYHPYYYILNIICDRVRIKAPLVRNLKNEIIKIYDKFFLKYQFL